MKHVVITCTLIQVRLLIWTADRSRADSRFVPSQWETALLYKDVSHWLGASLESARRSMIINLESWICNLLRFTKELLCYDDSRMDMVCHSMNHLQGILCITTIVGCFISWIVSRNSSSTRHSRYVRNAQIVAKIHTIDRLQGCQVVRNFLIL